MQRLLIILGTALIGGMGVFVVARDTQLSRDVRSVREQARVSEALAKAAPTITQKSITKAMLADDVFVTAALPDGSVTSAKIQDGAVTTEKLSADTILAFANGSTVTASSVLGRGSVTGWHLADGSITTAKIIDAAVTKAVLADGSVTELKIVDGAITNKKLANGSVTAAQLATGSVVTASLANGAVTNAKIDDGAIGGTNIQSAAISTDMVIDQSITAVKLASGAVTTGKIFDLGVTTAKVADGAVTTGKLFDLGVTTAKVADGAISSSKLADVSVTSGAIADGAVTTGKIFDLGITAAKVADGAITSTKLGDSSVTGSAIADGAILPRMISDGAVTGSSLGAGSVSTTNLVDGSVTTAKLADGAVTTAKLADLSVTAAKIATGTITATQIASDGGVVKSIVGNSIVSVTNNNNGSYSIVLTTSCAANQILKYSGSVWQCADDQGYFTPQDIYRFPYVGTQKTDWFDNSAESLTNHGGSAPNYLLYLGAGQSGVVRHVFMVGNNTLTDWTDMDDYELRIYTGAGTLTASDRLNPPSQYLDAQISLGPLLGAVYNVNRSTSSPVETAILDYGRSQDAALTLNLPIPFENGILIQVWKKSPAAPDSTHIAYHWTSYETGVSTFPYQSWRLKASSISHQVVSDDAGATFMNVTGKAGMLVGLFSSIKPTSGGEDYNEMNWTFYPDGETDPVWQVSGTEDIFGINPYYFSQGVQTHENWGSTYVDAGTAAYENYRLFVRDPLMWQDSIRGLYPTTGESVLDMNVVTLYYAEK